MECHHRWVDYGAWDTVRLHISRHIPTGHDPVIIHYLHDNHHEGIIVRMCQFYGINGYDVPAAALVRSASIPAGTI